MNWSLALIVLVPDPAVTVTSTVPVPAGAVAVREVELIGRERRPALAPKFTALTPTKFVPVTVTAVPPVLGPEAGLTPVTVGAGGGGPAVMVTFCTC